MAMLSRDLLHGLRSLRKSPGFATVAILTLSLGIGANTALFSVVNGVLLNPLPYPQSDRVVAVYARYPSDSRSPATYLNFLDWQHDNRTFSSLAIYRNQDYNLSGAVEPQRIRGYMVSADFFPVLGVSPILGRNFRPEDDRIGSAPVAIIGGGFWSREFGSSPAVLGRTLTLNGANYTVIGVIPASFTFYGQDRDVYTPIGQWNDPSFLDRRISVSARVIGRLRPGVTLAQAQDDMDVVARRLAVAFPVADKDVGINLIGMKQDIVGDVQPLLIVLLAAVGFLLLIACANVANLLLARGLSRSREFALRLALGAGRFRIIRHLLGESLLLAAAGAALGLLLASVALQAVLRTLPGTLPRTTEISLDARVLLFTAAVSLFAAVIFGLSPALRTSRADLHEVLKQGARGSASRHRLQGIFVALEVAMALVLLIGAGLMLRSLAALWRVDPGYNPAHAVTFSLALPGTPSTTAAETRGRLRAFDSAVRAIPGVQSVSITLGSRPMIHDSAIPFWIDGRPRPLTDNEMPGALFYLVESGFHDAMGITLLRGRFVGEHDNETAPLVIAIDDVFARTYFPGENPIGRHVHLEQFDVDAEIVGVVRHIRQWGPGPDAPSALEAQFFYPFMQLPAKLMPMIAGGVAVVLRIEGDPAPVMQQVRTAARQLDPREIIYAVQTMDEILARNLAARRFSMLLLTVFAALALVLACIGIYGVVSYLVGRRTREIGIRIALGAHRRDVLLLILSQGAKMAAIGIAAGLAAAFALTRLISRLLYGVAPDDPLTFLGVALLLFLVTLLASYIPARRALRIDPANALRAE